MKLSKKYYQAARMIANSNNIAIAGHVNPDGDCLGSLIALGLALKRIGKKVCMLSHDGVPVRYQTLPGARQVKKKKAIKPDLAIAIDCARKEQLGDIQKIFDQARSVLEIDHHSVRRTFGQLQLIDNKAAAVGAIIFYLLQLLHVPLTKAIAENLLTSFIVETNSFRLPGLRPQTFEICARLLQTGVNYYSIADTVYWTKTKASLQLTSLCLARCVFLKKRQIVWSLITQQDFKAVHGKKEDIDAVADDMRSIKEVKIAVLFREEQPGMLRVSLRSKEKINIAAIAERYDGGGHFDVAGCVIPYTQKAMQDLLKEVKKLIK